MNNEPQFFGTRKDIKSWLDKYHVYNYTINDDLSVGVNGDVKLSYKNLKTIPVKFGKVAGDFWCYNNQLTSLIGSPKTVKGDFWCSHNQLTSLAGAPESVDGSFWCNDNKLTNLTGAPKSVFGELWCEMCPLASLLELINCDFKQNIYFNIDKKNFKQKELIKILAKYYNFEYKRYGLIGHQFKDIIKSQIEKEALQDKLNSSKIKNKTRISFL